MGHTTLGENNVIHPFAVIGGEPQDFSYKGQPTRVEIGDHNIIREGVTIHRGTEKEDGRHPGRVEQLPDGQRPRRPRLHARRPDHDRQQHDVRRPRPRRVVSRPSPAAWGCTSSSSSAPTATSAACRGSSTTCPRTCSSRATPRRSAASTSSGLKRHNLSAEAIDVAARGAPADLPRQDDRQARRRDPRVARPSLPGGPEPARFHRGPAARQARPGPRTREEPDP